MSNQRPLFKAIGEIKSPGHRANWFQLVLAIIALSGVVYFLYHELSDSRTQDYKNLRQDYIDLKAEYKTRDSVSTARQDRINEINTIKIDRLQFRLDSVTFAFYRAEKEAANNIKETNNQKQALIKKSIQLLRK